ncbi:pyridoxamine phosphate oxidase family protein [Peziza echinospora]|nr:pyridoxamine phosphate oxidase family protein [Peziza echinospora]
MPQFYDQISPELREWVGKQSVFWTASAPLVGKHINLSPKGLPDASFSIFSPTEAAYIDFTGSGSETISHLYENGRITILFNSFGPSPKILRLFCKGRVVEAADTDEFTSIIVEKMGKSVPAGARAVIMLDVWKVQTSCGYGVPIVSAEGVFEERETLRKWAGSKVAKGEMGAYQVVWNSTSLDGLMGLRSARREKGERWLWAGDVRAWARRVVGMPDAVGVGLVGGLALGVVLARRWPWGN